MKILYLMHVDIKWIKQRPHFLAELLSKNNNILLFYAYSFARNKLTSTKSNYGGYPYFIWPFFFKSKIIRALNSFVLKIFFKIIVLIFRPKFIWITSPFQYKFFFKIDQKKIIYDCMDQHSEFFHDYQIKHEINQVEKKINDSAKIIICSSQLLSNKFDIKKTKIINNAFSFDWLDLIKEKKSKSTLGSNFSKDGFTLCYFGTISKWIDFDLLLAVKKYKFIRIKIIGPVEFLPKKIKSSGHIQLINQTSHKELLSHLDDVDAFIMPFILNDLILNVDPVKIYEYIVLNKPIISPFYNELNKFSKFINFYRNQHDFYQIMDYLIKNNFNTKFKEEDRLSFLNENSWHNRVNEINNILSKI